MQHERVAADSCKSYLERNGLLDIDAILDFLHGSLLETLYQWVSRLTQFKLLQSLLDLIQQLKLVDFFVGFDFSREFCEVELEK